MCSRCPAYPALPLAIAFLLMACAPRTPSGFEGGNEPFYLSRYVLLVCIGASYERLDPPAPQVVASLQQEAWVFVERGSQGPEVYERLHGLATDAGRGIPPQAAVRGCLSWQESPQTRQVLTETLRNPPARR